MKINASNLVSKPTLNSSKSVNKSNDKRANESNKDNVDIGPLSGQIKAMATSPSFDAQKVAQIKQAIADGQYQVNPQKIAEGLIQTAQELTNN